MMRYVTCCVDMPQAWVPDLNDMIERERQITYRTARHHIGLEPLAEAFPGYDWRPRPRDLTMKNDWHVTYHRSVFRGQRCIYIRWSAIEYIFVQQE